MIKTVVYDGERIENALRRFKKACEKEGLAKDIKRHEFYEKPSERDRRKRMKRRNFNENTTPQKSF